VPAASTPAASKDAAVDDVAHHEDAALAECGQELRPRSDAVLERQPGGNGRDVDLGGEGVDPPFATLLHGGSGIAKLSRSSMAMLAHIATSYRESYGKPLPAQDVEYLIGLLSS